MTKTEKVRLHLIEEGNITSWEAIEQYSATRLSAIIYNLRHHYGMNIENEKINFTDRFGDKSYYVKYVYRGEE